MLAQVVLDTVELTHNEPLLRFTAKQGITHFVISSHGPSGWPVVQFQGPHAALVKMIKCFWQDLDLCEYIEDVE